MEVAPRGQGADLEYFLHRDLGGFVLERAGHPPLRADDEGRLLFEFEQEMTLALQRMRRDLYFLHAAALAVPEGAALFVGDSGAGKSTLAWGLLHHGFEYLSDELAPIDPRELRVHPYPRALCLKDLPPEPYTLPPDAVQTSRGFHIAPHGRGPATAAARRVHAVFFLAPGAVARRAPAVRPMSRAEAGARLLANALNPLAHASHGLDPALEIARSAACFELFAADLRATCELVGATLADARIPAGTAR
jgi:hypothetical protein